MRADSPLSNKLWNASDAIVGVHGNNHRSKMVPPRRWANRMQ